MRFVQPRNLQIALHNFEIVQCNLQTPDLNPKLTLILTLTPNPNTNYSQTAQRNLQIAQLQKTLAILSLSGSIVHPSDTFQQYPLTCFF